MKPPSSHSGELIQVAFGPAELVVRLSSEYGEHKWAALFRSHQHIDRLVGQVDNVLLGILGTHLGQCPDAPREVQFVPLHPCHLFAPLSCYRQELNNSSIGAAHLPSCYDDLH